MEIVYSVNRVPIRLTGERWSHIVENHDEMAGRLDDVLEAIEQPAWVTRGFGGSLSAWKPYGRKGFLRVIYKELDKSDGFVITAFFCKKSDKGNKLWP